MYGEAVLLYVPPMCLSVDFERSLVSVDICDSTLANASLIIVETTSRTVRKTSSVVTNGKGMHNEGLWDNRLYAQELLSNGRCSLCTPFGSSHQWGCSQQGWLLP